MSKPYCSQSWIFFVSSTQHYEKDADGLCTQLKKPVAKKGNLDYSVDRQAFIDQGWVIPSKDLKLGEAIGKGEFGGNLPSLWFYAKKPVTCFEKQSLPSRVQSFNLRYTYILDVLKGEYKGSRVAVKSMKDSSKAAQTFLAEASVMT